MKKRKFRLDELRENLYLLSIIMGENGQKGWESVLLQARECIVELEKIKENEQ